MLLLRGPRPGAQLYLDIHLPLHELNLTPFFEQSPWQPRVSQRLDKVESFLERGFCLGILSWLLCGTSWMEQDCRILIDMWYSLGNNATMLEKFGSILCPTERHLLNEAFEECLCLSNSSFFKREGFL